MHRERQNENENEKDIIKCIKAYASHAHTLAHTLNQFTHMHKRFNRIFSSLKKCECWQFI